MSDHVSSTRLLSIVWEIQIIDNQFTIILDRFDQAWESGSAPRIDEFLSSMEQASRSQNLLVELIMIDLERRWRSHRQYQHVIADDDPSAASHLESQETPILSRRVGHRIQSQQAGGHVPW